MKLAIRKRREELNMTQQTLAETIGTTQGRVSKWENGTTSINTEHLIKLSRVLGISMEQILGVK